MDCFRKMRRMGRGNFIRLKKELLMEFGNKGNWLIKYQLYDQFYCLISNIIVITTALYTKSIIFI